MVIAGSSGELGGKYLEFLSERTQENVYGLDIRNPEISHFGEFLVCDLSEVEDVERAAKTVINADPSEITLVNFAGRVSNLPILSLIKRSSLSIDVKAWRRDFDDVFNPVLIPTLVFAAICAKKGVPLHIIQISSISARGVAGQSPYSGGKAGIEVVTKSLAKELGGMGVRLNTIRVGYVESASFRENTSQEKARAYRSRIGLGRYLKPEDLAVLIESVRHGTYLTGAIIDFDGAFD